MKGSSTVSSERGVRRGAWAAEEDILLRECIKKYGEGKWGQVPIRAGLNRCRKSCRLRWLNYLQPNIKRGEFEEDEVDLIVKMHKLLGNRWSLIAGRIPGRTANDIKNYYNTNLKKTCFTKNNTMKRKQVAVSHNNNAHGDFQDHDHPQILKRRRLCPKYGVIDHMDDRHVVTEVLRPQPRTFAKKSQLTISALPTPAWVNGNNNMTATTTRFPNNSQFVNKNTTKCLPLAVDDNVELKQLSNDQQIHDNNNTQWLRNILFGETEEEKEDPKKLKRKKKRVTSTNNALLEFESNTMKSVQEAMTKEDDGSDDQDAYYCNFDNNKGFEEGGSAGDNFWNSYFDENLWRMLGEEQEQYLMI